MQRSDAFDAEAFDRGVAVSRSASGAAGPLSTIFSCRTLGLTGVLSGAAQSDYLSGLLIGHEIFALTQLLGQTQAPLPAVILIGSDALIARYQRALDANGFPQVTLAEQATERGLWQVAVQAGLISSSSSAAGRPLHPEN
jgi:2-dehydro-3-deoxygalactonokinase